MFHLKPILVRYVPISALRNGALALLVAFFAATAINAEPVIVAALGDSLTAGFGLPPEDGLVPQLQAWAQAAGDEVTVINAGVSGDTTAGGLSRLDWTLTPDVQALIVTLGGNDMLRGLPPAEARANLDAILKAASERGLPVLLVSMAAPNNYGPDYKSEFDAIYPNLATQYGALLFSDFFSPLRAAAGDAASLRDYMQADGIHPNAAGVKLIVAGLGPKLHALIAAARTTGG